MVIVYKVVREKNGVLMSAFPRPYPGSDIGSSERAQLIYEVDKATIPEFGKIFAFRYQRDATRWFGGHRKVATMWQLWEAETTEAKDIFNIPVDDTSDLLYIFKSFWLGHEYPHLMMAAPVGTVACPELILIKRIR